MLSSFLFLLSTIVPSFAEGGSFTILSEHQEAPFEGVLFDVEATSRLLTIEHETMLRCDLRVEYEIDLQGTEFQLERDNFQAHLAAVESEYNLRIEQKDNEINRLQESIVNLSPRNEMYWFAAGTATGILITSGITYVILNSLESP